MTNPNEPALTCSEVVERLAKCCVPFAEANGSSGRFGYKFDREQATAILHSWRERRVQELEEALRQIVRTQISGKPDSMLMQEVVAMAEKALANSEWREQIRKGAKHE